jgi:hypothetical protein
MAARLLMSLEPLVHELAHDLESFLHVLNWIALSYMCHELDAKHMTETLNDVFKYTWQGKDGIAKGGNHKEDFLSKTQYSKKDLQYAKAGPSLGYISHRIQVRFPEIAL